MSSRKKKIPFHGYESTKDEDNFMRLTKSMMTSQIYYSLHDYSRTLYNYMKLWAMGKPTVEYSQTMAKEYLAKNTFYKARDELIEKGFLGYEVHNRYGHKSNVYKFSGEWRNKKP